MYIEGSVLFCMGALFSFFPTLERLEYALVTMPYFLGGIAFTLGSWFGVLEIVNIHYGNKDMSDPATERFSYFFEGRAQWNRLLNKGISRSTLVGF